MNKYIRTKDGRIVAIPNNSKLVLYDDEKLIIDTTKKGHTCVYGIVEKKANTIEELCDEFVIVDKLGNKPVIDNCVSVKNLKSNLEVLENVDIYCAIWTDKGLIYVAKMNSKGELELL